ncbi:MAG: VanZ family protein, partial [Bacteroidota bacterium]
MKSSRSHIWKKVFNGLAIPYLLISIWLLFLYPGGYLSHIDRLGRYEGGFHVHLIPFDTIIAYGKDLINPINPGDLKEAIINLFGNIALFIPLGFLIPFWGKWPDLKPRRLLWFAALCLGVELFQYGLGVGNFDIDDVILNI